MNELEAKAVPVRHGEPTDATVKQLYGTAFACGNPGCGAELYKVGASGDRVLNSRVAHIHARSEHGPRWDPDMSEADNRAADNLVLLCLLHAWEIDEYPDQFPAELLRQWKRAQLAEYERVRKSWPIKDADVLQAVSPLDLEQGFDRLAKLLPFSPGMRSRAEAWQIAARQARGRRVGRLTPLAAADRRDAIMGWMASTGGAVPAVPPGSLRILSGPMGSGKSEIAELWWKEGLDAAADDANIDIPLWLSPRLIRSGLEREVVSQLNGDPQRGCRIVIDDLDSVSAQDAARLLAEARQLVQVWPTLTVLATTRPAAYVVDEEAIKVEPWPIDRGAALLQVAVDEDFYWSRWNSETMDLLTSPLTALALAGRLRTGRGTTVSRVRLLSELAHMAIETRVDGASEAVWQDLAQMAVWALAPEGVVLTEHFLPYPRLRQLLDTDIAVADGRSLAFALPVFEQYFGAEALRTRLIDLKAAASDEAFPRWRYAIATAVAAAEPHDQEQLLIQLATINPASAFWVLDELSDNTKGRHLDPSDAQVDALISRRSGKAPSTEADPSIKAAGWLREAEEALLVGLGPLAASMGCHHGQLVQWGAWLHDGYLSLTRARDRVPPPAIVQLPEAHPDNMFAMGWQSWTAFPFPVDELGRWRLAQRHLQDRLEALVRRRSLPVPLDSWLARERMYELAEFVYDYGQRGQQRPIRLAELRDKLRPWIETADRSVRATWGFGRRQVDSEDVRWLAFQLSTLDSEQLEPTWPDSDQPHTGQWIWESYSPGLTESMAVVMVREALIGYRQLVETNFPRFGQALGMYSMLPSRVEGTVERPVHNHGAFTAQLTLMLHPDPASPNSAAPTVQVRVVNGHDSEIWERGGVHWHSVARTRFGQEPVQAMDLPLGAKRPATELAYRWLATDLAEIGWLRTPNRMI